MRVKAQKKKKEKKKQSPVTATEPRPTLLPYFYSSPCPLSTLPLSLSPGRPSFPRLLPPLSAPSAPLCAIPPIRHSVRHPAPARRRPHAASRVPTLDPRASRRGRPEGGRVRPPMP
jgi:hypothetical protein